MNRGPSSALGSRPPSTRAIYCLHDGDNPDSEPAASEIALRLKERGFTVHVALNAAATGPAAEPAAEPASLILLLGGDGFLMNTLHRLDYPPMPVLGVNFGSVGFLMNRRDCLPRLVDAIATGDFHEEEHAVIAARVRLDDGEELEVRAFNDFVIERMSGQSIRLRLFLDDTFFNRFSGDGLVLATAAGSTAYNLAAGGPVLHPELQALIITPLFPHRAAPFHSLQFSVLVPLTSRLRIEGDDLPKRAMRVLADGRALSRVSSLEVADSGRKVTLLRTKDHLFVRTLSRKFIGEPGDEC